MITRATPYLMLDGTAKDAIRFYEQALGAKADGVMTFGDMPGDPNQPTPEGVKDRIAHAVLKLGGNAEIMLSDSFPGAPSHAGNQVTICLNTDAGSAKQVFDALAEGGHVVMPLQQTFFSPAYGVVTDKFGVPFQIYAEGAHT